MVTDESLQIDRYLLKLTHFSFSAYYHHRHHQISFLGTFLISNLFCKPFFFSVSVFPFQIFYFTRLNFWILANDHEQIFYAFILCAFPIFLTFISTSDIKMYITLTVPLPKTLSGWVYIYLCDILYFYVTLLIYGPTVLYLRKRYSWNAMIRIIFSFFTKWTLYRI